MALVSIQLRMFLLLSSMLLLFYPVDTRAQATEKEQADSTVPNPMVTPGKICITDVKVICDTKWGSDERHFTPAMKVRVFNNYHISIHYKRTASGNKTPVFPHLPNGTAAYEIDHLASRELGGCDSVDNAWPQSYVGDWNAHMKDRLENALHKEVCSAPDSDQQQLLKQAQSLIITDWRKGYIERFGNPYPLDPIYKDKHAQDTNTTISDQEAYQQLGD